MVTIFFVFGVTEMLSRKVSMYSSLILGPREAMVEDRISGWGG